MIVFWLVSTNIQSVAAASKSSAARGSGFLSSIVNGFFAGVYRIRGGCPSRRRNNIPGPGEIPTPTSVDHLLDPMTFEGDPEGLIETEALLVMQDEAGEVKPRCSTNFEDEFEGEPV